MRVSDIGVAGLLLAVPTTLCGQILTGVVREDSTARPLAGVEVTIEGKSNRATTDSAGHYAFVVPSGVQVALFRMPGYRPLRMRVTVKGDTVRAEPALIPVAGATQLDPVLVNASPSRVATAGRDGFEERRARGFGKFVDSTQMRAREDRRLHDVLRELADVRFVEANETSVNELRAIYPFSNPSRSYIAGGRIMPGNPPCYVSVFFNGTTIYRSGRGSGVGKPPDFSRDFSVASLESVEYYRSASEVPPQFGGANANCGALVLWSRR